MILARFLVFVPGKLDLLIGFLYPLCGTIIVFFDVLLFLSMKVSYRIGKKNNLLNFLVFVAKKLWALLYSCLHLGPILRLG